MNTRNGRQTTIARGGWIALLVALVTLGGCDRIFGVDDCFALFGEHEIALSAHDAGLDAPDDDDASAIPDAPAPDAEVESDASAETDAGSTCSSPADCGPSSPCAIVACVSGACVETMVAKNAPATEQTGGDCLLARCDGQGGIVFVMTDDPPPADPCWLGVCQDSTPAILPAPSASVCEGGICDGAGHCVECIAGVQGCPLGSTCVQGACLPPTCTNGVQDAGELAADCGGPCLGCKGSPCTSYLDCSSAICLGGVCK